MEAIFICEFKSEIKHKNEFPKEEQQYLTKLLLLLFVFISRQCMTVKVQ